MLTTFTKMDYNIQSYYPCFQIIEKLSMIFRLNLLFFHRRRRQKRKECYFFQRKKVKTNGEKRNTKEIVPFLSLFLLLCFFLLFLLKKRKGRNEFLCLLFLSTQEHSFCFCLLLPLNNGRLKRKILLNFSII